MSTAFLSGGIAHFIGRDDWWVYFAFAFFATLGVYNGQRLFKAKAAMNTPWISWVKSNTRILTAVVIFSYSCASILVVFTNQLNSVNGAVLFFTAVVSAFYVVKINGVNMREIPYLKIHVIALTWSLVLILLPAYAKVPASELMVLLLAHYFYVLGVTIPFDIRDLKYDLPKQKTIPQIFGIIGARIIALFCILLFSLLMLYQHTELWTNYLFYIAVLSQMALIIGMNEEKSDLYCAGAIDGAITLLGLSYFI